MVILKFHTTVRRGEKTEALLFYLIPPLEIITYRDTPTALLLFRTRSSAKLFCTAIVYKCLVLKEERQCPKLRLLISVNPGTTSPPTLGELLISLKSPTPEMYY